MTTKNKQNLEIQKLSLSYYIKDYNEVISSFIF